MTRTRFLMAVATLSTVVAATLTAGQASADTQPAIVAGTTITDSSGSLTGLEDPIVSDDVTWGH